MRIVGLSPFEELLDYRRRVAEMYARVRSSNSNLEARAHDFRRTRDELFGTHSQSALSPEQKATFAGLSYFPYDPRWRFLLPVDTDVEPAVIDIQLQADGLTRLQRFGRIDFEVDGQRMSLSLFWISGYGGGLFLPFRDLTNKDTTYGGGRYLFDTIKHADLGHDEAKLVVDFNYAYNPSCAYHPRWHCPLAPVENHLPVSIPAGEQRYPDQPDQGSLG